VGHGKKCYERVSTAMRDWRIMDTVRRPCVHVHAREGWQWQWAGAWLNGVVVGRRWNGQASTISLRRV